MKRYISAYRFEIEKDEEGYWEDYAAPYCHAPDDDKDLCQITPTYRGESLKEA